MKVETIKSCDLSRDVAAGLLSLLNEGKVFYGNSDLIPEKVLVTDTEPKDLLYPEGWHYAKGNFTNKHQSSTGCYSSIIMLKKDGSFWEDYAKYCTAD